ncbi:MAG: DUF2147 domain-containing protein [Bacteroidota bacterium]
MRHLTCLLTVFLLPILMFADENAALLGVFWSPDKDGKIEFYEKGGKIFGRTVWSRNPEMRDTKNPDPAQKDRILIGTDCFLGLKADDDEWKGQIYNALDGKTYQCVAWLVDGGQTLKVRGYIGIPLLGQTVEFERIE